MSRRLRVAFTLMALVTSLVSFAPPTSGARTDVQAVRGSKPTGTFGRLQYHKESGDLGGLEVFVVHGLSGYMAVVQIAEGAPADPIVIPIKLEGSVVSFEMKSGPETLRYRGTVRADGLYGRFESGAFSDREDGFFLLRRGRSYWQD
jgi:hypothetical protein